MTDRQREHTAYLTIVSPQDININRQGELSHKEPALEFLCENDLVGAELGGWCCCRTGTRSTTKRLFFEK